MIEITGEQDSYLSDEFVGDDLKNIKHLYIRTQSPTMNTAGGRTGIADTLLQRGMNI